MSRVAKNPIKLPSGVSVTFNGNKINIKGSKGSLERNIHEAVSVKLEDDTMYFEPKSDLVTANALAGTTRAVVNNMVKGVSEGFVKELQLVGVGYKAQSKGNILGLTLGHSHPINYDVPQGITIETPTQTEIVVKGVDKELVGQVCADIIAYRKPEPYKGKGVRYKGQQIILKEAKKK
ncbi:MAG: 50S ribosomal protein L6 [Gammaproteobacteria bacterium]|nr:50S ribosomal protein L6 [Gammaproteobacteria bacterium]